MAQADLGPTCRKALLANTGRDPDEVIAVLPPRLGEATIRMLAINAALAGARPEHLQVIIAAIEAVADPAFNLPAVQTTTHPCSPLLIINGPLAARLGIASGAGALGPGPWANAVIGRAVRLALQNIGGARPGKEDRATLGHPGKYTYCVAENEAAWRLDWMDWIIPDFLLDWVIVVWPWSALLVYAEDAGVPLALLILAISVFLNVLLYTAVGALIGAIAGLTARRPTS